MKSRCEKIVILSEDIVQISRYSLGEEVDLTRLCRDHPEPFLFYDDKPILDINQDEFLMIFDANRNHYFLSPEQVVRIGEFCRIPLQNLIGLMLKSDWERYISLVIGGTYGSQTCYGNVIREMDYIEKTISGFKPRTERYYNLVKDNAISSSERITYGYIDLLINDLICGSTFLCGNNGIGKTYSMHEKENQEIIFLSTLNEAQKYEYGSRKEIWNLRSADLEDKLLFLENRKRFNNNTEDKYFRTFGKLEIEKSRLIYKIDKYDIILDIMQDKPELSYRELIVMAETQILKAETKRSECRNKINRCQNYIDNNITNNSQSCVTSDFKNKYSRECKKLLSKIRFMLHPDTASGYLSLTDYKKHQLNALWLKLMKDTNEENSFSPTMLLYHLPDYEQLESIYIKACEILDINPEYYEIGNRLEFMIGKGTPFNELMEFLKDEMNQLENHMLYLALVQDEYTNEKQTQVYRDALENINAFTEKLKDEIKSLKSEVKALKLKISSELKKVLYEQP